MNVLELDNYVPEKVCKQMCEIFDESEEMAGQREFFESEKLQLISCEMKNLSNKSKLRGKDWNNNMLMFAKGTNLAYKKWCEKFGVERESVTIEIPRAYRQDPDFGQHIVDNVDPKRVFSVFFYLNDVDKGDLKLNGKIYKSKMGKAIGFNSSPFQDLPSKNYMKYVVKCHLRKK
jgi:hypothetical protein